MPAIYPENQSLPLFHKWELSISVSIRPAAKSSRGMACHAPASDKVAYRT
ncbi:MAG: hypothetical protein AB1499_04185 [Nitrospirota bacterium]